MKWLFRPSPNRPLTHEEAKGCFAANLALPGAGSLAAGRAVGYAQLAVATIAFIISCIGIVAMIRWYLSTGGPKPNSDLLGLGNGADFQGNEFNLVELWRHLRWSLFGLGVFLISLFWGMITGWQILAEAPKNPPPVPPRIT